MTDEPIPAKYREMMNGLAQGIDEILNGDKRPKPIVFFLLMAEAGKVTDGRVNYISNADHREDMNALMIEFLARQSEACAIRHSFDGHGWQYIDSGSGSDWYQRGMQYPDAEPVFAFP